MKFAFHRQIACALLAVAATSNGYAGIVFPSPPDGGKQIVSDNVDRLLKSTPAFLPGLQFQDLTVDEPFRVYSIALTNLAAGQLFSAAQPNGWRYLLVHDSRAVQEANLTLSTEGPTRFSSLGASRFDEETRVALRQAQTLPQVKNHDYEFRYLDIPGIHFNGVWLHAASDDIIISLPPTWNRTGDYQVCTENEILQVLKPAAKRVLSFPAEPTSEDGRKALNREISLRLLSFDRDNSLEPAAPSLDATANPHAASFNLALKF